MSFFLRMKIIISLFLTLVNKIIIYVFSLQYFHQHLLSLKQHGLYVTLIYTTTFSIENNCTRLDMINHNKSERYKRL